MKKKLFKRFKTNVLNYRKKKNFFKEKFSLFIKKKLFKKYE